MVPSDVPSPLALRLHEAARALSISPRTLWQLAKSGQVPCVPLGSGRRKKIYLFPVAELHAWLARQTAKAEGGEA
jgi:predicted DNA-binding transcriptional regulator AlpA